MSNSASHITSVKLAKKNQKKFAGVYWKFDEFLKHPSFPEDKSKKFPLISFKLGTLTKKKCLLVIEDVQTPELEDPYHFLVSDIASEEEPCYWTYYWKNGGVYTRGRIRVFKIFSKMGLFEIEMVNFSHSMRRVKDLRLVRFLEKNKSSFIYKDIKCVLKEKNIPRDVKSALEYDKILCKSLEKVKEENMKKKDGKFYEKHWKHWDIHDIESFLLSLYVDIEHGIERKKFFDINSYVLYNNMIVNDVHQAQKLFKEIVKDRKEEESLFSSFKRHIEHKLLMKQHVIDKNILMKIKKSIIEVENNNGMFNYKKFIVLKKRIVKKLNNEPNKCVFTRKVEGKNEHFYTTFIKSEEEKLLKCDQKSLYDEKCCLNKLVLLMLHTRRLSHSSFDDFINEKEVEFKYLYYSVLGNMSSYYVYQFDDFLYNVEKGYKGEFVDFKQEELRKEMIKEMRFNFILNNKKGFGVDFELFGYNIASLIFRMYNYNMKIENISFQYFKKWNEALIKYVKGERKYISKEDFEAIMEKYCNKTIVEKEEHYDINKEKQFDVFFGRYKPYSRMEKEIEEYIERYLKIFEEIKIGEIVITKEGNDIYCKGKEAPCMMSIVAKIIVEWNVFNEFKLDGKLLEDVSQKNGTGTGKNCNEFAVEILKLLIEFLKFKVK